MFNFVEISLIRIEILRKGISLLKQYDAKKILNIALAGHSGSGKTSVAESILYLSKMSERLGKVADGNTVLDFDSEGNIKNFFSVVLFNFVEISLIRIEILRLGFLKKQFSTFLQTQSISSFLTKSLQSVRQNGSPVSPRLQQATLPVMQSLLHQAHRVRFSNNQVFKALVLRAFPFVENCFFRKPNR